MKYEGDENETKGVGQKKCKKGDFIVKIHSLIEDRRYNKIGGCKMLCEARKA